MTRNTNENSYDKSTTRAITMKVITLFDSRKDTQLILQVFWTPLVSRVIGKNIISVMEIQA